MGGKAELLDSSSLSFLTTIGVQFGGAAVLGFPIGYALKKAAKLLLQIALVSVGIVSGIFLAALYSLESLGVVTITINYDRLQTLGDSAGNWIIAQASILAPLILSAITQFTAATGGFGLGLALGVKKA
jgi:uncharacterized membrane protein (Fun14 family)